MCATRGSPLLSLSTWQDTEEGPWVASSSPPPSQEPCRGYPINNFQLHLTLQSQPSHLPSGPLQWDFPCLSLCSRLVPGTLAALAGFAAHLAEVGSATELKFEHQGAVSHLVHILAFFWAISRRHHTVTLGLTLLHGGRPQGLSAFSRWLASVAGAAHCALLLAEATLCGALTPLTGHPAGRRAAAQVASHSRWWLGCRRAVPRGQSGSLVCTLTKDHSVAETRPTAWGTLRPVQGCPLRGAHWALAGLQHRWAWLWTGAVI